MHLWKASLRNLRRDWVKAVSLIITVSICVTLLVASMSVITITNEAFPRFLKESKHGNADVTIYGKSRTFHDAIIADIKAREGVKDYLGILTDRIELIGASNDEFYKAQIGRYQDYNLSNQILVFGFSDYETEILNFKLAAGDLGKQGIVMPKSIANQYQLEIGDNLHFRTKMGSRTLAITAIVNDHHYISGPQSLQDEQLQTWSAAIPLPVLQKWIGEYDRVQRILVQMNEQADLTHFKEELIHHSAMSDQVLIQPLLVNFEHYYHDLNQYYSILYIICAIGIILTALILFNIFYILIFDRAKEIGVKLSIGYSFKEIRRDILAEGMLLTLVGVILGIFIGLAVTPIMLNYTFQQLEISEASRQFAILAPIIAGFTVLAVSIAICLLAAHVYISANENMINSGHDGTRARSGLYLLIIGLTAIILGLIINSNYSMVPYFLGIALLFPYIMIIMRKGIEPLIKLLFSYEGMLATRYIDNYQVRSNKQFYSSASLLTFCIILLVMISSYQSSLQQHMDKIIEQSEFKELDIRVNHVIDEQINGLMDIDGVVSISPYMRATSYWTADGYVIQFPIQSFHDTLPVDYDHELNHGLENKLRNKNTIVMGKRAFQEWGGKLGDTILLDTPKGQQQLEVVGVLDTVRQNGFFAVMDELNFIETFGDHIKSDALITLRAGQNEEAIRQQVIQKLGAHTIVQILSLEDYREQWLQSSNKTYHLLENTLMTILVTSGVGIFIALVLTLRHQGRDMRLMSQLGLQKRQLRKFTIAQGVYIGLVAIICGWFFGIIFILKQGLYGETIFISWEAVLISTLISFIVIFFFSLIPAYHATNKKPV